MKIVSFGYRDQVELDLGANAQVFDCRRLHNPHLDPMLRPLTGLAQAVQDFVLLNSRSAQRLIDEAVEVALTQGQDLAFGCVGGRHRSVAVAEVVAKTLRLAGHDVEVVHHALAQIA